MQDTVVMNFRIDPSLKTAFEAACKANDQTPSQILRAAVRDYLAKNAQPDLLSPRKARK